MKLKKLLPLMLVTVLCLVMFAGCSEVAMESGDRFIMGIEAILAGISDAISGAFVALLSAIVGAFSGLFVLLQEFVYLIIEVIKTFL